MEKYIGEIRLFVGDYAPEDWHICDGTVLPIRGNDALYAVIGTTYGGDGISTFALPDLRDTLHDNRKPFPAISYIIAMAGAYPVSD